MSETTDKIVASFTTTAAGLDKVVAQCLAAKAQILAESTYVADAAEIRRREEETYEWNRDAARKARDAEQAEKDKVREKAFAERKAAQDAVDADYKRLQILEQSLPNTVADAVKKSEAILRTVLEKEYTRSKELDAAKDATRFSMLTIENENLKKDAARLTAENERLTTEARAAQASIKQVAEKAIDAAAGIKASADSQMDRTTQAMANASTRKA